MAIPKELQNVDFFSIIFSLLLTTICSGILGYEREKRNQAAGFRTYIIVSDAAALVMLVNISLFQTIGGSDPVRMGAQVISGIGFLGAGAILVTKNNQVRGLTTAAGLWASAIIGMAFGAGYYAGGIICFFFIYITLRFLAKIDAKISQAPRTACYYCELNTRKDFGQLIRFITASNMRISNVEINNLTTDLNQESAVTFTLHTDGKRELKVITEELSAVDGVAFISQV